MENPFSYQQPLQTMYLSTVGNQKNTRPQTATRDNLKIDDISGARPKFIEKPIKPRQSYNNRNDDIAKSKPKVLIPTEVNKTSYYMKVDDIKGTKSKMNKFTTMRKTNPLTPQYILPQVQYCPVDSPKFIRDNMLIYDIEGTSTKESFAMRLQKQGKVLNTKEQILQQLQFKKSNYGRKNYVNKQLDVSDICVKKVIFKGNRSTNPLDPQYILPAENNGCDIYGVIEKSQPSKSKIINSNSNLSLETADIDGAKTKINNFVSPHKQEIKEAKPQSFKKGIISDRNTNPLNPIYKYPGWSEAQNLAASHSFQRQKTAHQRFDAFIHK